MNNTELIRKARELCERARWKNKWDRGMSDERFGAVSRTIVPQLCDALEAALNRATQAEAALAKEDTNA